LKLLGFKAAIIAAKWKTAKARMQLSATIGLGAAMVKRRPRQADRQQCSNTITTQSDAFCPYIRQTFKAFLVGNPK
jgi:hypothetical protein